MNHAIPRFVTKPMPCTVLDLSMKYRITAVCVPPLFKPFLLTFMSLATSCLTVYLFQIVIAVNQALPVAHGLLVTLIVEQPCQTSYTTITPDSTCVPHTVIAFTEGEGTGPTGQLFGHISEVIDLDQGGITIPSNESDFKLTITSATSDADGSSIQPVVHTCGPDAGTTSITSENGEYTLYVINSGCDIGQWYVKFNEVSCLTAAQETNAEHSFQFTYQVSDACGCSGCTPVCQTVCVNVTEPCDIVLNCVPVCTCPPPEPANCWGETAACIACLNRHCQTSYTTITPDTLVVPPTVIAFNEEDGQCGPTGKLFGSISEVVDLDEGGGGIPISTTMPFNLTIISAVGDATGCPIDPVVHTCGPNAGTVSLTSENGEVTLYIYDSGPKVGQWYVTFNESCNPTLCNETDAMHSFGFISEISSNCGVCTPDIQTVFVDVHEPCDIVLNCVPVSDCHSCESSVACGAWASCDPNCGQHCQTSYTTITPDSTGVPHTVIAFTEGVGTGPTGQLFGSISEVIDLDQGGLTIPSNESDFKLSITSATSDVDGSCLQPVVHTCGPDAGTTSITSENGEVTLYIYNSGPDIGQWYVKFNEVPGLTPAQETSAEHRFEFTYQVYLILAVAPAPHLYVKPYV